jgi:hypothetical protein
MKIFLLLMRKLKGKLLANRLSYKKRMKLYNRIQCCSLYIQSLFFLFGFTLELLFSSAKFYWKESYTRTLRRAKNIHTKTDTTTCFDCFQENSKSNPIFGAFHQFSLQFCVGLRYFILF